MSFIHIFTGLSTDIRKGVDIISLDFVQTRKCYYVCMKAMKHTVSKKLERLGQFFNLTDVIHSNIDSRYVDEYYNANKFAYSLLHTKEHFVHMGISKTGSYRKSDLYVHATEIEGMVKQDGAEKVLELAVGRGGNSYWLAKRNSDVKVTGIDVSTVQLSFANKLASTLSNFETLKASYEDLSLFDDNSFDLVFVIEALCHSNDSTKVLREVRRVLKPNGHFVVYDGYRTKQDSRYTENERTAMRLLEVGVAVEHFDVYQLFKMNARQNGFEVIYAENLSKHVIPTMRRFERRARLFFKLGFAAKLLLRCLPRKFSYNIISGYLFPTVMECGLFSYQSTVFQKTRK